MIMMSQHDALHFSSHAMWHDSVSLAGEPHGNPTWCTSYLSLSVRWGRPSVRDYLVHTFQHRLCLPLCMFSPFGLVLIHLLLNFSAFEQDSLYNFLFSRIWSFSHNFLTSRMQTFGSVELKLKKELTICSQNLCWGTTIKFCQTKYEKSDYETLSWLYETVSVFTYQLEWCGQIGEQTLDIQ